MRTIAHIKVRRLCPSQNASCRIHVPISNVPTVWTKMRSDRKRFVHNLTTVGAKLRSEMRRHLINLTASTFSLAIKYLYKLRPSGIRDCPSKMVVLDHVAHPQILNCYSSVAVNVPPSRLVRMVPTLALDLQMLFGYGLSCLLAAGEFPLSASKLLGSLLETAWVFVRLSFRVSQDNLESNIQSNRRAFFNWRCFAHVTDDDDVPVAIGPQDKMRGLWCAFERSMLLGLDPASKFFGYTKESTIGIKVYIPPATVLPELDRMPVVRSLKAWEADLLAKLFAVKESLEGFVQSIGECLDCSLWYVIAATSFEAIREVVPTKRPRQ